MLEQMISMNDSGDFQDAESNYSGKLSHVSSQLVMIPSSRSMLSRENMLKEFTHAHHKQNEDQFHKQQDRGHYSQEM